MDITLYVNNSEIQAINKVLSSGTIISGTLREESSVINPSFLVEFVNPSSFNYCYIPEFGRYYFIRNITSVRNTIWRINCDVDVLMSFRTQILNLSVTVSDLSNGESNASTYMQGDVWKPTVKTKTDIITFPSGLLDSGEYILITSGGVASS